MNNNNKISERYDRQIKLKQLGETGQQKLLQAKVLVVGAGGLGCPALQYLTAAGIGTIGIIDNDRVSLSNLHRQPLYSTDDIGSFKAITAAGKLKQLNPETDILAYNTRLDSSNALTILAPFDIIIDGSDNFATRYLVNDACVLLNKTLVYGAVSQTEGQVAVFNHRQPGMAAANYRDLFPVSPAEGEVLNCVEAGVLGVLPGIIGTMLANETIKLITGMGTPLVNQLLIFNALENQFYETSIPAKNETRSLIPANATVFQSLDYEWMCASAPSLLEIDAEEFDRLVATPGVVIIDVREPDETPEVTEFTHSRVPLSVLKSEWKAGDNTIVVFCQSGKRSLDAAKYLSAQSTSVFSLKGGIVQWKQHHQNKQTV